MPRFVARDLSGNGQSARVFALEQQRQLTIYNSANGETGEVYWARDWPNAKVFIVDVDCGAGDTVVLETRSDSSAAWAIEQTITTDIAYEFVPTEQFRIRRTVAAATTKAWLTVRK